MRSSFARKLVYLGLALGLFVVILVIRGPIERIRTTNKLSDATLGGVDPTSSTMLLVLGGLRGVAANVLWKEALDLQKEQDWTNLEVVVKSITKLEPHFISIWTFQGWNLAYNVSVEWDQVEDKYYWIKEGIKFLRQGTDANEHSPELRWDVGWTYFHKIGKADEADLLRKLYRADDKRELVSQGHAQDAFNPDGLDNYQTSQGWFQKAVDKCDQLKVRPKRMGEVAFRSYPAHAQTDFALAREKDGQFGEVIMRDWLVALKLWEVYADFEFQYTDNKNVKLDYSQEIYTDLYRAVTIYTRSKALNEGLTKDWEKIKVEELFEFTKLVWSDKSPQELDKLSPAERADLKREWVSGLWQMLQRDTPRALLEFGAATVQILPEGAGEAMAAMRASFEKLRNLDGSVLTSNGSEEASARREVAEFAAPAETLGKLSDEELYWCDRYASMINYRYWKERSACESEMETIGARMHFFEGLKAFRAGDLNKAKTELKDGLDAWKAVLDKFERVRNDDLTAEETVDVVKTYLAVRDQLDLPQLPPDEVPFQDFIKKLTPFVPTPEEYDMMRKAYTEQQKNPEAAEELKKQMMEKMKGKSGGVVPPKPIMNIEGGSGVPK